MAKITLQDVSKAYHDLLKIDDPHIIKFLQAAIITQNLPGDPFWPFLVGPSSSGKTEFLTSLYKINNVWPVTSLTANTLLSGAKSSQGQETSLLNQIQSGIIIIEDFTIMMSEYKEEKGKIMAQLRSVHGGYFDKKVGTGEKLKWEGKITFIVGVTPDIHRFRQQFAQMGERFINFELVAGSDKQREESADRALRNTEDWHQKERRKDLQDVVGKYHNESIVMPSDRFTLSDSLHKDIKTLANFASCARSSVPRDWSSPRKDLSGIVYKEQPPRFVTQLSTLAQGILTINTNEYNKAELVGDDLGIISRAALSSITDYRRRMLQELSQYPSLSTKGLAMKMGYPTSTVHTWLNDLASLGLAHREEQRGSKGDIWTIKDNYRDIMIKYDNVTTQDYELNEQTAVDKEGTKGEAQPEAQPKEVEDESEQVSNESMRLINDIIP